MFSFSLQVRPNLQRHIRTQHPSGDTKLYLDRHVLDINRGKPKGTLCVLITVWKPPFQRFFTSAQTMADHHATVKKRERERMALPFDPQRRPISVADWLQRERSDFSDSSLSSFPRCPFFFFLPLRPKFAIGPKRFQSHQPEIIPARPQRSPS